MALSDKQVKDFQEIYKKRFGKEISVQEAYEKGIMLVRLLAVIYKPMTEEEYATYSKEDEDTKKQMGF
jgi:hypothetical protein